MIKFYATRNFVLYCDGHFYRKAEFVYLDDCIEYIQKHYNEHSSFLVSSGDTGEVYFEIIRYGFLSSQKM